MDTEKEIRQCANDMKKVFKRRGDFLYHSTIGRTTDTDYTKEETEDLLRWIFEEKKEFYNKGILVPAMKRAFRKELQLIRN